MSHKANHASSNLAVRFLGAGEFYQIVDANAGSDTQANDVKIDRGVPNWFVAEYESLYADKSDALWFDVEFSGGSNSIMF